LAPVGKKFVKILYHQELFQRILQLQIFSDPPSLNVIYSRNHTIVEGENLTLQCRVTAANPEPNITWYKGTVNSSTALSYGANFTLTNISRADAGNYYCTVGNGIGKPAISRISVVTVLCKYCICKDNDNYL